MQLVYGNEGMCIYVGERSRNTNYSGIIVYVERTKGNVIFSGDSLLVQASDVLGEAWHDEGYDKEHYLVVPHHGGDNKSKKVYKTYVIPDNLAAKAAIISVDEANNSYGHPSNDMIDYLKSVAKWEILRTDKDDLSGAFNLSRDLLEDIRWEHEERMNEILAEDLFRDNTETQNQNK